MLNVIPIRPFILGDIFVEPGFLHTPDMCSVIGDTLLKRAKRPPHLHKLSEPCLIVLGCLKYTLRAGLFELPAIC